VSGGWLAQRLRDRDRPAPVNTGLGAVGSTHRRYSNSRLWSPPLARATGERWSLAQVCGAAAVLIGIVLTRTAAAGNPLTGLRRPTVPPEPS
jgi:hypothetical protein